MSQVIEDAARLSGGGYETMHVILKYSLSRVISQAHYCLLESLFFYFFSPYVSSYILMFPAIVRTNENKALYEGMTSQQKVGLAH